MALANSLPSFRNKWNANEAMAGFQRGRFERQSQSGGKREMAIPDWMETLSALYTHTHTFTHSHTHTLTHRGFSFLELTRQPVSSLD